MNIDDSSSEVSKNSNIYPNIGINNNLNGMVTNDNNLVHDNICNTPEDMPENKLYTKEEIEQQQHSNILDIQSSKSLRNKNINNPFIGYLNINSLRNKIDDLKSIIHDIKPEVITISETKIDHAFPHAQFLIDGYQNPGDFRKDRNKHGGGLITYIRKGIPHKILPDLEPKNIEVTCIELTFGKRKWGYVAIYRPPNQNIKAFITELTKCLEQITNHYDHIIVTGDININTKD